MKEVFEALQQRLKELSLNATHEQVAYLAKALESLAGKTVAFDIYQLSQEKVEALLSQATKSFTQIEEAKSKLQSDIESQKATALQDFQTEQERILTALENQALQKMQLIETQGNQYTAQIDAKWDEMKTELGEALTTFESVNDIPENSTIMTEITRHALSQEQALPLLFGIASCGQEYYGEDNFQYPTNATGTQILNFITGRGESMAWAKPVQLHFFNGIDGSFFYKSLQMVHAIEESQYQNPHALLGCWFIKNTTNEAITKAFKVGGSSQTTSGLAFYQIQKDGTETLLKEVNESQDGDLIECSVTLPANETTAFVLQTRALYKTTINECYALFEQWLVSGISNADGLEIDKAMTLRAWECTESNLWD